MRPYRVFRIKLCLRRVVAVAALGSIILMSVPNTVSARPAPPSLFVYPLGYRLAGHGRLNSPQTLAVAQITSDLPLPTAAAGVVLVVYWSTLCPDPNTCDFSLIDRSLAYWRARDKKVVLSVVTTGYPILTERGLQTPAPTWVMSTVRNYTMDSRVLGSPQDSQPTSNPDFRDPRFLALEEILVRALSKYDGDPALAQIRISTGAMGEDNPVLGRPMHPGAGLTERAWLDYTTVLAKVYFRYFHRTQLEFDMGRVGFFALEGTRDDRGAVNMLFNDFARHNVLVTSNGLDSDTLARLNNPGKDIFAEELSVLMGYKATGGDVGLEAAQHAGGPMMLDLPAIVAAVGRVRPKRLVLFSDEGGRKATLDHLMTAIGYQVRSAR